MEALEERLQSATSRPAADPYRFFTLIADTVVTGRPVLAFELARSAAADSPSALAAAATALAAAGADALIVPTDSSDTPEGLADLFAVCRAAPGVPVLRRDWFLHPLQVVDAKESGCAGILGVVASVTGARGTPVLSSFAAALGTLSFSFFSQVFYCLKRFLLRLQVPGHPFTLRYHE